MELTPDKAEKSLYSADLLDLIYLHKYNEGVSFLMQKHE